MKAAYWMAICNGCVLDERTGLRSADLADVHTIHVFGELGKGKAKSQLVAQISLVTGQISVLSAIARPDNLKRVQKLIATLPDEKRTPIVYTIAEAHFGLDGESNAHSTVGRAFGWRTDEVEVLLEVRETLQVRIKTREGVEVFWL